MLRLPIILSCTPESISEEEVLGKRTYNVYKKRKKSSPLKRFFAVAVCAAVVVGAFLLMVKLTGNGDGTDSGSAQSSDGSQGNVVVPSDSDAQNVIAAPIKDVEVTSSIDTTNNKLPDEIKNLITGYNEEKYKALGSLVYTSLEDYFDTSDKYGQMYADFCNTSLKFLIFVRESRAADLSFGTASFEIKVTNVKLSNGVFTVNYEISEAVDFEFSPVTAYSCGMEVEAKIAKGEDGKYKFVQLAEDTDVNLLFEEKVMNYLGYDFDEYYLKDMTIPDDFNSTQVLGNILGDLKLEAEKNITEQAEQLAKFNAAPSDFAVAAAAEHEYDRDAAVDYAYRWVGTDDIVRNSSFSDYSSFGGNCQNYVSQCLLAGGIPMDCEGTYEQQWKWFDDYTEYAETAEGRTPSWSGTEHFYDYCNKNTGDGLVAVTDCNIYSGAVGDVMQYVVDGWSHHSVIITKIIYDDNGNVVDYLINSNTTDRVDFPLSAYGYTDIRLIRIVGYND